MPEPKSPFKRVRRAFDRDTLKRVCEMHETDFADLYNMAVTVTPPAHRWAIDPDPEYQDFYAFLDRGSDVLAVAHLDTVVKHTSRKTGFLDTAAGPVVHSGALDDRLGAYTILELLPKLGVNVDVLLTTGEESGNSTAQHFASEKDYNWIIEFDRGGTDVVMYQYEEKYLVDMVKECGARVGSGSYSDIAYLEHLGVKAFNWGVGYEDYHCTRGYAYLEDYWGMIAHFLKFHEVWHDVELPHEEERKTYGRSLSWLHDEDNYETCIYHPDQPPYDWRMGDCEKCEEELLEYRAATSGGLLALEAPDHEDEDKADAAAQEAAWAVVDGDVISDDFDVVNRQLTSATEG